MSEHAETVDALGQLVRFAADVGGDVLVSHARYGPAPPHLRHIMGPELQQQYVVVFNTRVPCMGQAPELGAAIANCQDAVRKAWTCPQCDERLRTDRERCNHCDWTRPK